jgi:hypothetical protein
MIPDQINSQVVTVRTPECPECHQSSLVRLSKGQYDLLISNQGHIQDVFPGWSADQRELLISGTHKECWVKIFTDRDEDPEDEDVWDDEAPEPESVA